MCVSSTIREALEHDYPLATVHARGYGPQIPIAAIAPERVFGRLTGSRLRVRQILA